MPKHAGLMIICNGCGEAMRELGEWPVQWPQADKPKDLRQTMRYICETCRTPHPEYDKGTPVGIAILIEVD